MAKIEQGRITHEYDGELVIFLIGMRVNRWWRPDVWWPVVRAMPGMLTELYREPDSGLLGHRLTVGGGGALLVQYWNSQEKLYAYATDLTAKHRPAWTNFNRRLRRGRGAVGIWHETYQVERAESIYSGMPVTGLAKATRAVPVAARADRAAQRYAAGLTSAARG